LVSFIGPATSSYRCGRAAPAARVGDAHCRKVYTCGGRPISCRWSAARRGPTRGAIATWSLTSRHPR